LTPPVGRSNLDLNMGSSSEAAFKLRQRFKTDTRAAILEAAAGVLAEAPAGRVRMEDIAGSAGIAVGTLYNYFQDRATLVGALLETRTQPLLDALDGAAATTAGESFDRRLARFIETLAVYFETNKNLLSVLLDEERSRGQDARAASRRHTVLQEISTRAEKLLREGVNQGALRRGDPVLYAALLVGMVRGLVASTLDGGVGPMAETTPMLLEVFLEGTTA
jgi:AcrR family transcriptional regulator